jgi:hypothetical protein
MKIEWKTWDQFLFNKSVKIDDNFHTIVLLAMFFQKIWLKDPSAVECLILPPGLGRCF